LRAIKELRVADLAAAVALAELLDWSDAVVSQTALGVAAAQARRALDERGALFSEHCRWVLEQVARAGGKRG